MQLYNYQSIIPSLLPYSLICTEMEERHKQELDEFDKNPQEAMKDDQANNHDNSNNNNNDNNNNIINVDKTNIEPFKFNLEPLSVPNQSNVNVTTATTTTTSTPATNNTNKVKQTKRKGTKPPANMQFKS